MKLGEVQELKVAKKVDFGVYLIEEGNEDVRVLLPAKQVPSNLVIGDKIKVFLYKDSEDRLIATVNSPLITVGGMAALKVKDFGKIGAFLDWGLEKDLFLPYKEMVGRVEVGDEILVRMYIDKSERLCASMKGLYHMLSQKAPYEKGETVTGRVYEFSDNFGTFVAVDDKFSARIPKHEDTTKLKIGQVIEAKISDVKADGKIDLTLREAAYLQMDEDAESVYLLIEEYGGVLPFTEKATPEVIMRETGLSKNAFKRAVGRLYKDRKVELTETSIRLVK